jgi:hypothetical protein
MNNRRSHAPPQCHSVKEYLLESKPSDLDYVVYNQILPNLKVWTPNLKVWTPNLKVWTPNLKVWMPRLNLMALNHHLKTALPISVA